MESTTPLDSDFSRELRITGEMKGFLKETAKWAKFLSIVGFVGLAFMVIAALFMGTMMGSMMDSIPQDPNFPMPMRAFTGLMSGIYLVFSIIYFFPLYYQFQFASNTQIAIRTNDQQGMSDALSFLKSTYKFWGILMAIFVGFYALIFIFSIVAGSAAVLF